MGLKALWQLLQLAIWSHFNKGSPISNSPAESSTEPSSSSASSAVSPNQPAPGQPEPLQAYDTGADIYAQRRFRQFLMYVVLPIVVFCGGGWYLIMGRPPEQQTSILGTKMSSPTVRATKIISGDTVLGGPVGVVGSVTPTAEKVAYVVPSATPAGRIKCYAIRDAHSPYTDKVILSQGLFFADAFTRVNGGMIWNKQFGWFKLVDFGCAPGIEQLEIEFVQPPPTAMPKPIVIVPTRTKTPIPSATPLPTPVPTVTPQPGIIFFDYFDCGDVTWLAWGVTRVYLTVGTSRSGVPGDENGRAVHRSLCDSVGKKVRLDAFLPNGQQIYREGVLQ